MSSRRFSLQISPLPFSRKKPKVVETENFEAEDSSGRRYTETDASLKNRLINLLINKHRGQNESVGKNCNQEEQLRINENNFTALVEHEPDDSVGSSDSCSENFIELEEQKRRLNRKMDAIKDKLKSIHKSQGNNVEHFLTVAENMPKFNIETNPQLFRVRQNFEKKNRQSAQIVNNLQKKMETYQQKMKNIDAQIQQPSLRPRTSTMPNNHLYYLSAVPKSFVSKFWKKSESTGDLTVNPKTEDGYLNNNNFKKAKSGKTMFYIPTSYDRSVSENVTKLDRNNFYHDNDEPDVFQRKDKSQLLQNKSQFLHDLNKNFEQLFNDLGLFRSDLEKTQIQINELTNQMHEQYSYFNQALNEEKLHLDNIENQSYGQFELYTADLANLRNEIQNVEDRLTYQINTSMRDLNDETEQLHVEVESLNSKITNVQRYVGMEVSESFSTVSQKFKRSSIIIMQLLADVLLWIVTLLNKFNLKKVVITSIALFVFYQFSKIVLLIFNVD